MMANDVIYYQWKIEFQYLGVKTSILVDNIYVSFMFRLNEQLPGENKPIKHIKIAHYNTST